MNPLVSIIIPVYNRGSLLMETLRSVQKQSYLHWECILVDDGSTDNSKEVAQGFAKEDPRFKSVSRPDNRPKGANACRNYGFEISSGDLINWFDSDDLMHQDFLIYKVESFSETVDCVISKTQFFKDSIENVTGKEHRTYLTDTLLEDFITLQVSWYLPDPMWKRSFLTGKPLFDEMLLKGQDRDFHIRRILEQPSIVIIDKYLTYYRQHDAVISNNYSIPVIRSYYNALNTRIALLIGYGMSKNLRFFLLKQQIKNYPYLYKDKNSFSSFFGVFKKLFVLNYKNVVWFLKFMLSMVFLKTTGKGSSILKG